MVYSCIKFIKGERTKIDVIELLKKMIIRAFIGYGFVTLNCAKLITLSVINSRWYVFIDLPYIYIRSVEFDDKSLFNISRKLRIYKIDGEIFLNPPREIPEILINAAKAKKKAIWISSKSEHGNKTIEHPGIKEFDGDGSQVAIQLTSRPIPEMNGFWVTRITNMGKTRSFFCVNTIYQQNNLRYDKAFTSLKNHNIKSIEDMEYLFARVVTTRLLEKGIRIEDEFGKCLYTISDETIVYGANSANKILQEHGKPNLNNNMIKMFNCHIDNFERLSSSNKKDIIKIFDVNRSKDINLFKDIDLTEEDKFLIHSLNIPHTVKEIIADR